MIEKRKKNPSFDLPGSFLHFVFLLLFSFRVQKKRVAAPVPARGGPLRVQQGVERALRGVDASAVAEIAKVAGEELRDEGGAPLAGGGGGGVDGRRSGGRGEAPF